MPGEDNTLLLNYNIENEMESETLVRNMFVISVSTITYIRNIFPESAFKRAMIEGLSLRVLRSGSSCKGSSDLLRWTKGVLDALRHKYLKTVVLAVFKDPLNKELIDEAYMFNFKYLNGITVMEMGGFESPNKALIQQAQTAQELMALLRKIFLLTENLIPLANSVRITMKLYYVDGTPMEYEPPGFVRSSKCAFEFRRKFITCTFGRVHTPFHKVTMSLQTIDSAITRDDDDTGASVIFYPPAEDEKLPSADVSQNSQLCAIANDKSDAADAGPLIEGQDVEFDVQEVIENLNCPCGIKSDSGPFIRCKRCMKFVHVACLGDLRMESSTYAESCYMCSPGDKAYYVCKDKDLLAEHAGDIRSLCIWRRVLLFCCMHDRFTYQKLAVFLSSEESALEVIERLVKLKLVKTNRNVDYFRVIDDKVIEQYYRYFIPFIELTKDNTDAAPHIDKSFQESKDLQTTDQQQPCAKVSTPERISEERSPLSDISNLIHADITYRRSALSRVSDRTNTSRASGAKRSYDGTDGNNMSNVAAKRRAYKASDVETRIHVPRKQ